MEQINFAVYERTGTAKPDAPIEYPVSFMLAFKPGEYEHDQTPSLCVYTDDGERVPTQVKVLTYWWEKDDSIRHVKITCLPILKSFVTNLQLRQGNHQKLTNTDLDKSILTADLTAGTTSYAMTVSQYHDQVGYYDTILELNPPAGTKAPLKLVTHENHIKLQKTNTSIIEVDVLLLNSNLDKRGGQPPVTASLNIKHPGYTAVIRWAKDGLPCDPGRDDSTILTNHKLYDLCGHWRKLVLIRNEYYSTALARLAANPPTAVLPDTYYKDRPLGAWPFETFPADRTKSPTFIGTVKPEEKGALFRLPEYGARLTRSCTTGGWPYASDNFVATGSPADLDKQIQMAMGETTILPQAIFGYEHSSWGTIALDEAPYCGGSWRAFEVKRNPESLPARDGEHGWGTYHVYGAWEATGDPILAWWLTSCAHMRVAELLKLTRYPDGSERAIAHALAHATHGFIVSGDSAILNAMTKAVADLRKDKNYNWRYGTGYGSFKTGMLMRSIIGVMQELPTSHATYWEGMMHLARWDAWARRYGNYAHQLSTATVLLKPAGTAKSGISNLTWVDPLAWFARRFTFPSALNHLSKYMNGVLGKHPTGNFKTWTGQYEGRYYLEKELAPINPVWLADPKISYEIFEEDLSIPIQINFAPGTVEHLVTYSRYPLKADLDNNAPKDQPADNRCWWAGAQLSSGQTPTDGVLKLALPVRTDGKPWYIAVMGWDSEGRRNKIALATINSV